MKTRKLFTPARIVAILGIFAVIVFCSGKAKTPSQSEKYGSDTTPVSAPVSATQETAGSFWNYLESIIADLLYGII